MQEKSRFMVSWVPYRNRVAGVWFRQEKPLRFRAGPAGAAPAPSGPGKSAGSGDAPSPESERDATVARDSSELWRLSRDHFHARRKAEFAEKFFAIFPRETERAHVGDTEPADDGRKSPGITLGKLAVHEGALRPVHQLHQRDLVVEIRGDFVGDRLFRNCHEVILHFLVAWRFNISCLPG